MTVEWEEPLPTLTGRAWAFGMVLTAADVLPARHAGLKATEAARHVFADIDPSLACRVEAGDVVVVEELRGAATEGAPYAALRASGIVAIVARLYEAGLEDVVLAAGVVAVSLDAPAFIHTGDRVRIDFEAAKIVNLSSGDRAAIRNLDERRRKGLRALLLGRAAT